MSGAERETRLVGEVLTRHAGCPDADELQSYAVAGLAEERRAEIGEHARDCPSCAAALRRLDGAASETHHLPEQVRERSEQWIREHTGADDTATRPGRRTAPLLWLAGMASAAALLVFLLLPPGDPVGDVAAPLRQNAGLTIESAVPGDQALPRADCRLRWTAAPDGSLYTVRVMSPDLRSLATGEALTDPEYVVPAGLLDGVETIVWQVVVFLPEGGRQTSETFVNRLE